MPENLIHPSSRIDINFPDKLDYLSINGYDNSLESNKEYIRKNNLEINKYRMYVNNSYKLLLNDKAIKEFANLNGQHSQQFPTCEFFNFPKSLSFFELHNFVDTSKIDKTCKIGLFYTKLSDKKTIKKFEKNLKKK